MTVLNIKGAMIAAARRYMPQATHVDVEHEPLTNDYRVRVSIPLFGREVYCKQFVVPSYTFDNVRDQDKFAEICMRDVGRELQDFISANAKPPEDVLAILAMARMEYRLDQVDQTWLLWTEIDGVRGDCKIDCEATPDEFRQCCAAIIDTINLRQKYPHLAISINRPFAPRATQRQMERMMSPPKDGMYGHAVEELDCRYAEYMRRGEYAHAQQLVAARQQEIQRLMENQLRAQPQWVANEESIAKYSKLFNPLGKHL